MIYTRILLNDQECEDVLTCLDYFIVHVASTSKPQLQALYKQIELAKLQTIRIRENEKAGVK